ncbi:MAG: zinc-ribbon domain-containing protein [Thaumarchaeota archaeon]|nr:zinc-ribbon domain-containing protein [Nitrososphaerota archaeon]
MSRTGPYRPPPIGRKGLLGMTIGVLIIGLAMFATPRGVGSGAPIMETIGILFLLGAVGIYMYSRSWSECPHCGKDVKRTEPVCPNCGKRIFGETT